MQKVMIFFGSQNVEHKGQKEKERNAGPEYMCAVCQRLLFCHQVIIRMMRIQGRVCWWFHLLGLALPTLTYTSVMLRTADCHVMKRPQGTLRICYACHRKIGVGTALQTTWFRKLVHHS